MKQGETKTPFQCYLTELKYSYVGRVGYLVRLDSLPKEPGKLRIKKELPKWEFIYLEDVNRYTQEQPDSSRFDD